MKLILPADLLLEVSDYRSFLSAVYEKNKQHNAAFSYAYMAKRCHFSSKSFLKEVIDGKKKLSLKSAHQIVAGLDLPATWGQYFLLLVNSVDQSLPRQKNHSIQELKRFKARLKKQKASALQLKDSDIFELSHWPWIYAALGDSENGATLPDIRIRTGLEESILKKGLERLMKEKMVEKKGNSYFALHETAFFENLAKSKFFKNFYLQSVERLYFKARSDFESADALFFSMALSVDPKKMAAFKESLAALLDEYTESIEDPQGSKVATLICGFNLL